MEMTGGAQPAVPDIGQDVARDADGRGDEAVADIVVVTTGASEIETAALMAVLSEVVAEATSNTVEVIPGPSAWDRRQHVRMPIVPGPGAWRSFAG